MRISEKNIAYKLQSHNFYIFYDAKNNCFIATYYICNDCNALWSPSINQCIFCGTKNHFSHICTSCGNVTSITSASKSNKCQHCGSTGTLKKNCFNTDCPSNTDKTLQTSILNNTNSEKGIFDRISPFMLPTNFCNDCGSSDLRIITKEFITKDIDQESKYIESDHSEDLVTFDLVIIYSKESQRYMIISSSDKTKSFMMI